MKKIYSLLVVFILVLSGCNQETQNEQNYTVTSTSTSYSGVLKSSKENSYPIIDGMVLNVVNGQSVETGTILFSTIDKQAQSLYDTSVSERNYAQEDLNILVTKINNLKTKINNESDESQKLSLSSELESLTEQETSLKRSIVKQNAVISSINVQGQTVASYPAQIKLDDKNLTIESIEKQAITSLSNVLINEFNKDVAYKLILDNVTYDLLYQSEVFNQSKSNDTLAYYDVAFNIVDAPVLRNGYPVEIKSTLEKIYVPRDYIITKDDKLYVQQEGSEIEINAVLIDTRYEIISGIKVDDILQLPSKDSNDKTS